MTNQINVRDVQLYGAKNNRLHFDCPEHQPELAQALARRVHMLFESHPFMERIRGNISSGIDEANVQLQFFVDEKGISVDVLHQDAPNQWTSLSQHTYLIESGYYTPSTEASSSTDAPPSHIPQKEDRDLANIAPRMIADANRIYGNCLADHSRTDSVPLKPTRVTPLSTEPHSISDPIHSIQMSISQPNLSPLKIQEFRELCKQVNQIEDQIVAILPNANLPRLNPIDPSKATPQELLQSMQQVGVHLGLMQDAILALNTTHLQAEQEFNLAKETFEPIRDLLSQKNNQLTSELTTARETLSKERESFVNTLGELEAQIKTTEAQFSTAHEKAQQNYQQNLDQLQQSHTQAIGEREALDQQQTIKREALHTTQLEALTKEHTQQVRELEAQYNSQMEPLQQHLNQFQKMLHAIEGHLSSIEEKLEISPARAADDSLQSRLRNTRDRIAVIDKTLKAGAHNIASLTDSFEQSKMKVASALEVLARTQEANKRLLNQIEAQQTQFATQKGQFEHSLQDHLTQASQLKAQQDKTLTDLQKKLDSSLTELEAAKQQYAAARTQAEQKHSLQVAQLKALQIETLSGLQQTQKDHASEVAQLEALHSKALAGAQQQFDAHSSQLTNHIDQLTQEVSALKNLIAQNAEAKTLKQMEKARHKQEAEEAAKREEELRRQEQLAKEAAESSLANDETLNLASAKTIVADLQSLNQSPTASSSSLDEALIDYSLRSQLETNLELYKASHNLKYATNSILFDQTKHDISLSQIQKQLANIQHECKVTLGRTATNYKNIEILFKNATTSAANFKNDLSEIKKLIENYKEEKTDENRLKLKTKIKTTLENYLKKQPLKNAVTLKVLLQGPITYTSHTGENTVNLGKTYPHLKTQTESFITEFGAILEILVPMVQKEPIAASTESRRRSTGVHSPSPSSSKSKSISDDRSSAR